MSLIHTKQELNDYIYLTLGLYGYSELERARIDMVMYCMEDIVMPIMDIRSMEDQEEAVNIITLVKIAHY